MAPVISNVSIQTLPFVHAQSNADMIATTTTFVANTNGISERGNNDTNSGSPFQNNNGIVTSNLNATDIEGLQIKKNVTYFDGASGYLVYPTNATTGTLSKKLPAVVMVHEWWGLNNNIKTMANTLAKQGGYVVLAVDLFKGQSTDDPARAMQLVNTVTNNPQESISNLQAAVKYLSSIPFVNSSKIASIGWCFGGGQSLQLALHSEQHPLAGNVLYYGTPLVTDKQELSKIKWPILGFFGDKDQNIPLSKINSFKATLDSIGIKNQIYIYKGLGHTFANPSGSTYAPKETTDAWGKTLNFFKDIFNE
jgi:carboxymethylenebutenolidase